jgi:hypothetical protein
MSSKQLATITAADALDGTERFHLVQGDNSRRATVEQVADYLRSVARTESFVICLSDEITDLEADTAVVTMRWPYDFVPTAVRASVTTAPTDAAIQVDINVGGVSILDT